MAVTFLTNEDKDELVSDSGWNPNKYLGTDEKGNVVEKEAPSGDSVTDEQIQNAVNEYLEENPVSGVITDNTFDVNSVNPVQNKVITQALTTGVMEIKGMPSLEEFKVDWENGTFSGGTGLPNTDVTNRIRTSNYIPIDTQTVVSVKENADIEFCPMYYGENQKFISTPNAYQITDLVIESGGDVKFIKLMARKKSNANAVIDADYGDNLSLKRLVDNATLKAFYTPNEVDEKISQVGTIDTVFDADSTNAIANNALLEVFETGNINKYEFVSGNTEIITPEWELGAFNGEGNENDVSTRIRTVDYIEIDSKITVSTTISSGGFCPVYFDSNKNFVSNPNAYQTTSLVLMPSDTIKYFRLFAKVNDDNPTIEEGNQYITITKEIGGSNLPAGTIEPTWINGTISGDDGKDNSSGTTRIKTADYIAVGDKLTISKKTTSEYGFCPLYYDKDYSFLGSTNKYQTETLEVYGTDYAYVRLMCNYGDTSWGNVGISIVREVEQSGEDGASKQLVTKKVMYTASEIDQMTGNYWQGKTLIWTGDSIPHGQTMEGNVATPYPQIVAKNLGMTLKNYAIGGSTFAKKSNYGTAFGSKTDFDNAEKDTRLYYDVITGQTYTTYGYDTSSSTWKAMGAGVSRTPLSERLHLMVDGDLVVYAGGTNDFQYNWTEVGTMEDRDNTTFYGALHITILALLEKYYGKQIIFCTPIKRCQNPYTTITSKNNSNLTLKEYGNIIKEVCDYYSIPVIDLYSVSGLNPHVASQSALFDSYKTHPLQAGHDILGAVMTTRIRATRNA